MPPKDARVGPSPASAIAMSAILACKAKSEFTKENVPGKEKRPAAPSGGRRQRLRFQAPALPPSRGWVPGATAVGWRRPMSRNASMTVQAHRIDMSVPGLASERIRIERAVRLAAARLRRPGVLDFSFEAGPHDRRERLPVESIETLITRACELKRCDRKCRPRAVGSRQPRLPAPRRPAHRAAGGRQHRRHTLACRADSDRHERARISRHLPSNCTATRHYRHGAAHRLQVLLGAV